MKEYIEREAALVAIKNLYPGIPFVKALRQRWHDDNRAYMQCERAVEHIPAADVVEVVRCQECKFAEYMPGPMDYLCRRNGVCFRGRDFCSYGERKMDGGADK